MTDWRERRLGGRARLWGKGGGRRTRKPPAEGAPLIITLAIRNSARDHAEQAVKALAELVGGASSEHVRVAAANAILDRAVGKPLPGSKAAEDLTDYEDDEDGEEGGDELEVRWLDPGKT